MEAGTGEGIADNIVSGSMSKTRISTQGIKSILRDHHFSEEKYYKSIGEYIWNGFDAKAFIVNLTIKTNERGRIIKLIVKDNGNGIQFDSLKKKFEPFYESEKLKELQKNMSSFHGYRGIGRFTFFIFANFATWNTTYSENGKKYQYKIKISAAKLDDYDVIENIKETNEHVGTEVEFDGFLDDLLIERDYTRLLNYLKREFGWFLELNKHAAYKIVVNGVPLDYSDIIGERDSREFTIGSEKTKFNADFIRWNQSINEEFSRYYFLDGESKEKFTEYTTLNKKADEFYHSLYVRSDYFKEFNFNTVQDKQTALETKNRNDRVFKELISSLDVYLKEKRKPFLKQVSHKFISTLKEDGIINAPLNQFQLMETEELEGVIKCIYEIQPSIFNGLSKDQKNTFVKMLEMVMSCEDRDRLLGVISQVVSLDQNDKKELEELLQVTSLSNIIRMGAMLKNRYKILQILKKMVFDEEFDANEVDHLQKVVEDHTWIFGEEYSVLGAAEDDFDKLLREFRKKIFNEKEITPMKDKRKRKQVDIFICKKIKQNGRVNNIIIELKAPEVHLGQVQLDQVKGYLSIIKKESRFNADSFDWTYILIGTKFDSSGYVENELESNAQHHLSGLVQKVANHRIFVKKWSDLINECEDRLDFLNSKLKIQKENLVKDIKTPDEAVVTSNSIKDYT